MVRNLSALACAAALCLAPISAEASSTLKVVIDQAQTIRLSRPAAGIVIGNPSIAGVAIHDQRTLLVTGRAYGSTNLMVMDAAGRKIFESVVAVHGAGVSELTIVRAGGTASYSCVDKCRGVVQVGDEQGHFESILGTQAGKSGAASQ
ncbi:MAG: pilus assembly protein N-terminal domain-containing protein [Pseudomonadota bacterium]